MLSQFSVKPTLPSTDLQRSKDFYVNRLGLKLVRETEGDLMLEAGEGTHLYLYKRGPSKADHTLAEFKVPDVEKLVDEMTGKGIKFEQYDIPGFLKTNEKGIADMNREKGAWFKDPDGNILAISQMG